MSQESHHQAAHEPSSGNVHTGGSVHTGHPKPSTYFKVAMTLGALTAFEVAALYMDWLGHGIIPVLALLSGAKFILVAMYYMHLKFDSRIFSGMFVAGLIVAAGVIFALMALFRFFV